MIRCIHLRAVITVICLFVLVMQPNVALAKMTPDMPVHHEINEQLWSWLDCHLADLFQESGRPERLNNLFYSKMIALMEHDGFVFSDQDKAIFSESSYPESQTSRWSLHYFCTTLIGPYIDWTIQDQYAFYSIICKAGLIGDEYGYLPADPQLIKDTPSVIYESAAQLAYDTYGLSNNELSEYDVLVEFQTFSHPSEPPHERWSVLWCTYHDMIEDYYLVVTYHIQEDRWSIALFD